MTGLDLKSKVETAAAFIRSHVDEPPEIGLILGTGLGGVADGLKRCVSLSYDSIPHYPVSTVESHHGHLIFGEWRGRRVAVLQGRCHLYEGYSAAEVSFPVRVLKALGVRMLVISNAAGGLNPGFEAGDLMLVTDHINVTGHNPLIGVNVDEWGLRFPDMSEPYSRRLIKTAEDTALAERIRLRRGVYVGVVGPNLETAAETRFLRMIGADAVGMSMIMEVITAVHAGLEVLGISVITNVNLPDCYQPTTLEAVIAAASRAGERFIRLLGGLFERLP